MAVRIVRLDEKGPYVKHEGMKYRFEGPIRLAVPGLIRHEDSWRTPVFRVHEGDRLDIKFGPIGFAGCGIASVVGQNVRLSSEENG